MASEGNGWFVYTIPNANCSNVIFSNNGASQTGNLNRCGEGWYNNGVWTSTMPAGRLASAEETDINNDIIGDLMLEHFPNPASDHTIVTFYLKEPALVKLDLYDINGRKIHDLIDEVLAEGKHTVEMDASSLNPGLYSLRLKVGKAFTTRRVVIVR
jgi:hypothetical protein